MSKINLGHAPSYTIPLDSLDLTYLGKYVQNPRAERMPLWTKKRLDGDSEYCQVQIVMHSNNNEDSYSETFDTYLCHICNKNVPKICYQKHNLSDQHETIKKIYQKVLERLSKQIDLNVINTDEDIAKDFYYCKSCSKIVKIENKNKHEGTEYHAKSVKDLNITNEFYKLILNENVSEENEELVEAEIEPDNSNENYYFDESMEASSIDSDDDLLVRNSIQLPLLPGPSTVGTKNESPKEVKKQTFEEYLKDMIKKYNLNVASPVVEGDFITIGAQHGGQVKVSREHFHSYKDITNNTYCQLCNMWISKDTRAHDITERHVRSIFRPINDKFARWYDSFSDHCVPCNVVVLNSNLHHQNDAHKMLVINTLVSKCKQTLCEACNLYIDTHNFAVHLTSKKYINVLMQQNSMQDTDTNNIYCKICNVTIPKNTLKFHIGTKLHVARKTNETAYTELSVKSNESTEIKDENNKNNASTLIKDNKNENLVLGVKVPGPTFCGVCKVKVPIGGLKIHINGKQHRTKLDKLNSANKNDIKPNGNKAQIAAKPGSSTNTVSSNSNNRIGDSVASSTMSSSTNSGIESEDEDAKIDGYYDLTEFVDKTRTIVKCKICSVNINFGERYIIEHMEGKNHIKNANKQKINKQKIESYNNQLLYPNGAKTDPKCLICKVKIPNNERNIIEHMEGANHITNANKQKNYKQKIEAYNNQLLYPDNENTGPKCLICEVNVSNNERNIIEHMEGKNHEIAKNEFLKFNSITKESSEFVCECCNMRFISFIEHINSKNHTLNFFNKCKFDKNEMRKYVYENVNNSVSRPYRLLYKNLLKYNEILKLDEENHFCGNCVLNLNRASEIDHVLGERHRLKMEEGNNFQF